MNPHFLFDANRQPVHALVLLRLRLQGLFGRSFQLAVRSEIGEGSTVSMRIPLQFSLADQGSRSHPRGDFAPYRALFSVSAADPY
jgi:hypothetical protein